MHVPRMHRILPLSIFLCSLSVWGKGPGQQENCGAAPGPCPTIRLDWGTWQATSYDELGDFYTFKNIRFGQPPVGRLRFAASVKPEKIEDPAQVQYSKEGAACIAIEPSDLSLKKCRFKTGLGLGAGTPYFQPDTIQNEDCLFLDLYVPRSAINRSKPNVPVVVWFHGGAFLLGSKDPPGWNGVLYGGTSFLREAKKMGREMIFVAGNYRLGAFGWLAGHDMESDGTPNAGLTDQQLLLEWVHDHIALVGGDNTQVSAWGESAGGSSILHHLIAHNGDRDPLFQKAILQSPAYYWAWDRSPGGALDQAYWNFTREAGCSNRDIVCLRKANVDMLIKANRKVATQGKCAGRMPFGPAVDGNLVKDLPPVAFQKGNFWRKIDSMILSHVVHESNKFVPPGLIKRRGVEEFIESIFPSVASEIESSPLYSEYGLWNQHQRLVDIARDAFFTGNILQLFDAYQSISKVYITKYAWPYDALAGHGLDLLPTFYYSGANIEAAVKNLIPDVIPGKDRETKWYIKQLEFFAPRYQQYFVSHAITGNPNTLTDPSDTVPHIWNTAKDSNGIIAQVMQSTGPTASGRDTCTIKNPQCYSEIADEVLEQAVGDFWKNIASKLTQSSSSSVSPSLPDPNVKEEL